MKHTNYSPYEQPGLTVDLVILTLHEGQLKVLLARRAEEPFAGAWSIPGGFVRKSESLEDAAQRIMREKTGVQDAYLEQLYTFGRLDRDPRDRVITVAYFALVPWQALGSPVSTKVADLEWCPVNELPELAFDHLEIVDCATSRLRAKAGYSNIGYGLLPAEFSLTDLQKVYEGLLGKKLDKRNFRKQILSSGLLRPTGVKAGGVHRPAMLYTFVRREIVFWD